MGPITITGAIIIVTTWMALIEFDHLDEAERKGILQQIRINPFYFITVLLLPLGIMMNVFGSFIRYGPMIITGATIILIHALLVSFIFWGRTPWKGILLFLVVFSLGIFLYLPYML